MEKQDDTENTPIADKNFLAELEPNCHMPLESPSRHRSLLKPMGMSRELTAVADTQVVQMEFDCRPGAIAASLSLREPKYQETAAYCHFGREPVAKDGIKFFEWENSKDLTKYKTMNSAGAASALKDIDEHGRLCGPLPSHDQTCPRTCNPVGILGSQMLMH